MSLLPEDEPLGKHVLNQKAVSADHRVYGLKPHELDHSNQGDSVLTSFSGDCELCGQSQQAPAILGRSRQWIVLHYN